MAPKPSYWPGVWTNRGSGYSAVCLDDTFPGMADPDRDLDINLALVVLKPPESGIAPGILEAIGLAADAISIVNPEAGLAIKAAAVLGAWPYQRRKWDRVEQVLIGLRDRIDRVVREQTGAADQYVRRPEFADLLEDTVRRIADKPDSNRREAMRAVFLRILDKPLDHTENRRFIRLCDELPTAALEALNVISTARPVVPNALSHGIDVRSIIAESTGRDHEEIEEAIDQLTNELLLREGVKANYFPVETSPIDHFLTRTGKLFLKYIRGSWHHGQLIHCRQENGP
jgi:hypothetical protein